MFQIGDRVRVVGETVVGEVERIIGDVAIVRYKDRKSKTHIENLVAAGENYYITPARYDEVVKGLMYQAAEDAGNSEDLDYILKIIGMVCGQLKARLFDGN